MQRLDGANSHDSWELYRENGALRRSDAGIQKNFSRRPFVVRPSRCEASAGGYGRGAALVYLHRALDGSCLDGEVVHLIDYALHRLVEPGEANHPPITTVLDPDLEALYRDR